MIKIIHLSDLHLDSDKNTKHEELIKKLLLDIKDHIDDNTLIIFSGDFLNKGGMNFEININPYDAVKSNFLDLITNEYPILKRKIFFVPGNHEVVRNQINKFKDFPFKESLMKSSSTLKDYIRSVYKCDSEVNGLNSYNDFVASYYDDFDNDSKQITQLDNSFIIKLDEKKIGISALNSSWLCYDDMDKNNILLGETQIENSISYIKNCDVKIAIVHHSTPFLNEIEQSDIEKLLYNNYDMIFIGHTHEHVSNYVTGIHGNYFVSVGKSLTAENSKSHNYKNGYSIIEYTPNIKLKVYFRKYDDYSQTFVENNDFGINNGILEIPISILNQNVTEPIQVSKLEIDSDFKEFLTDTGANFTHRSRESLKLDDIYVMPFLDRFNVSDSEEKLSSVNGQLVLDEVINGNLKQIVLLGEENSGKTTLSKVFYTKLYNEGFAPVYIKGKDVKQTSTEEIQKLVEKEFFKQYNCKLVECKFKLFVIIDDFNESSLKLKFKRRFINNLYSFNYLTLIVWDEFFTLGELLESKTVDVNIYEVLKFGAKKRFELICKWTDLFSEEFDDLASKVSHNYHLEKIIDSVIGKNLVPSYPIYILTILQANELTSNQNFEQSTFGHYYDVLIKSALGQNIKENKEIEKYYSYLSELSYWNFNNSKMKLSEDDFLEFHQYFLSIYNVNSSFVETINTLINSNIVLKTGDCYKLKYKYIYFYFIGKYLSDNIEEESIKNIITDLSKRLYQTDCANIYLFLSHHSKSKYVIREIVENAKELFNTEDILNFKDDLKDINLLVEDTSESIDFNSSKTYIDYKNEELIEKSKIEILDNDVTNEKLEYNLEDNPNSIDYISQMNKSFKTIEILGHIIKNRYASLKTEDKEEIIEELYILGLRTLSSVFKTLIEGEEYLKAEVIDLIKNQSNSSLTPREKESLAKQIMFNILYMISYSVFKKISTSLSSKDLQLTFKDVKDKYPTNNAVGLIDIAIKMEYHKNFPYDDTKLLIDKFRNNKLPYYILRRIGVNFMKMIPMKEQDQQRVGELLNVSMETQRLLELTSVTIKRMKN